MLPARNPSRLRDNVRGVRTDGEEEGDRRAEACSCLPLTRGPCPQGVQVIRLVSQAGTGYFYTKLKNFKAGVEKLQLLKFDPVVNKRVLFKEERIKK